MPKKSIILQLKPNKNARHLIFDIELRTQQHKARDWETLEEVEGLPVLSVCGSYRLGSVGCQTQDTIRTYRERVRPEDLETFDFILYIWDKYHLNDMKAGTKQQTATLKGSGCKGWASSYSEDCHKLESLGLLYDRGYKYGSGWLYLPIEAEDLADIEKLVK